MSNQAYYKTPAHKAWRRAIYRRDNFRCQWPGCNSNKNLEAHHIKRIANFPELRENLSNGISLCEACHRKTFDCEEKFEEMFIKIIEDKNKDVFSIKRFMYFGED